MGDVGKEHSMESSVRHFGPALNVKGVWNTRVQLVNKSIDITLYIVHTSGDICL